MFRIKQAAISDLPVVQQLAHSIWPKTYAEILSANQLAYMLELIYALPALEEQFSTQGQTFLILEYSGEPIGFASYSLTDLEKGTYHLHKIYIDSTFLGQGTGSYFLQHIINLVKAAGGKDLQLNVNRHNKAKHFYEKGGFTVLRQEDIPIGEGYFMNDFVMGKTLT